MKPGKPLQRRTPLAAGTTGLSRRAGLRATTPATAEAGKPRTARQRADAATERHCRRLVKARCGGWCELRIAGVCLGRYTNLSHRVARGQGGPWDPSNVVAACGSGTTGCHGWLHSNPALAKSQGWMLPPWRDPAAEPLWVYTPEGDRVWVLLTVDGGREPAPWRDALTEHPDDLPVVLTNPYPLGLPSGDREAGAA